jgi:hypothetical protein
MGLCEDSGGVDEGNGWGRGVTQLDLQFFARLGWDGERKCWWQGTNFSNDDSDSAFVSKLYDEKSREIIDRMRACFLNKISISIPKKNPCYASKSLNHVHADADARAKFRATTLPAHI